MVLGFAGALELFGVVAWVSAVAAIFLFRAERPRKAAGR
jgi:hypothetical protein